jgi:MFS family permease
MTPRYGWVIVGVGMAVTCVGFGAMLSLGVFLQPMAEAMGWSRTGIATAAMLNFLAMGVGSFAWGALSDRFGTRAVVLSGGALLGLGMVLASRASTLLEFQVLYGVVVGVATGSFYTPLISTTARWFTEHRSLAVALVSAGLSVGSTVMAPLARWMISAFDWRTAMMVLGDLVWLVVIPAAFLVRQPPAAAGTAAPAAVPAAGSEPALAQVLRTPQFAAIALTHFACCAAHSGPIFHMVTHAIDRGVPAMAAATVLSAAGLASLTGKIGCGIFADRAGARRTLVAGLALQAVAIALYLLAGGLGSFYALGLVFGFAYGGVMPLYAIVVREAFGERVMGAALGAVSFASTLGMALGPWIGGWMYDALGGYAWMFAGSAAIGLGAVAVATTLPGPRAPAVPRLAPRPTPS